MTKENMQTILDNTLGSFNRNHELELTYDENPGESFKVLKILNSSGGSFSQVKCTKSQAIDLIQFMSHYMNEYEVRHFIAS